MQTRTSLFRLTLAGGMLLLAIATAAAPAHASLTPVNTNFAVASTNVALIDANRNAIFCPRSTGAGRLAADGNSISLTIAFGGSVVGTCWLESFGQEFSVSDFSCVVTVRAESSVAGTSLVANVVVDSVCSIEVDLGIGGRCTIDVQPQGLLRAATFTQATQRMQLDGRGVRITTGTSGSRRACPGAARTASFSGTYVATPVFTIS
jgi:hypothetical protein